MKKKKIFKKLRGLIDEQAVSDIAHFIYIVDSLDFRNPYSQLEFELEQIPDDNTSDIMKYLKSKILSQIALKKLFKAKELNKKMEKKIAINPLAKIAIKHLLSADNILGTPTQCSNIALGLDLEYNILSKKDRKELANNCFPHGNVHEDFFNLLKETFTMKYVEDSIFDELEGVVSGD